MRPILTGLFGALVWMLRDLKNAKYPTDTAGKKFNFKKYFSVSWDDWLFSALGGVLSAYSYPLLVQLLNKGTGYNIVIEKGWEIPAEMFFGFVGGIILERITSFLFKN